jgi:hypothetical protein
MAKIEYRDRKLVDCGFSDAITQNDIHDISKCPEVKDVAAALHLPRKLEETAMFEVAWLVFQIIVVRYVTYVVLRRRTRTS